MILYFLFILCGFCQEVQEQQNEIKIGQIVQGFISSENNNYELYYIEMQEIDKKSDLVIMLKSHDITTDPNIYVSSTNIAPMNAEEANILACESKGQDICIIKYEEIEKIKILFISVVSKIPTRYFLKIEQDQETLVMSPYFSDFMSFLLSYEQPMRLINLKVDGYDQEQELEVKVKMSNFEEIEEPLTILMNKKENGIPSLSHYDFQGKDAWDDTKVIEFTLRNSNDEYIILITGQQGAKIIITFQGYEKKKHLRKLESIYQVVEKYDVDIYYAQVFEDSIYKCDIAFHLIMFQGSASMYVNLNEQPLLLEQYRWNLTGSSQLQYTFTWDEYQKEINQIGTFYIAIYGQEYCSYQLKYACHDIDGEIFLYQNEMFLSQVKPQQMKIFRIYDSTGQSINVEINIFSGQLEFSVSECNTKFNITKDIHYFKDLHQYANQSNFTYFSPLDHNFEFTLNSSQICFWEILSQSVGEQANSTAQFSIKYSKTEKHQMLLENTPKKSFVAMNQSKYYKYLVSEKDEITKLTIQVTPLEGQANIFISVTNQKPDGNNYLFMSQNNQIILDKYELEKNGYGFYYISLHGLSLCKYTIVVWTIRGVEDSNLYGQYPWHYMILYQGSSQQYFIKQDETALFKINLKNYYRKKHESVIINLQQILGQVEMFGFSHPSTDESDYFWRSTTQINVIQQSECPEIMYLRIKVLNQLFYQSEFRLTYRFQTDTVQLFNGQQYFAFISANETQNFVYETFWYRRFIITKQSYQFNSSKALEIIPNQKSSHLVLQFSKSNNSIEAGLIFQYDIIRTQNIVFHFSIHSEEDQFYSVIASDKLQSQMHLQENQPLTKHIPIVEDKFDIIVLDEELNILLFSYAVKLDVSARAWIPKEFESRCSITVENERKAKNQILYYQYLITFTKTNLQQLKCLPEFFSVEITIQSADKDFSENLQLEEYTVQFHQQSILLRKGETQQGEFVMNKFKYYKIKINEQDLKKNLLIFVNGIDQCSTSFYVSQNQFPNETHYDWFVDRGNGENLIIKPSPNLESIYFVGVLGLINCEFLIQYQLDNIQLYHIFFNTPVKLQMNEESIIYFHLFNQRSNQNLQIFTFSELQSSIKFYVNEEQEFDILQLNTNIQNYKYNNSELGYADYLQIKSDFIEESHIIIAIKSFLYQIVQIQVFDQSDGYISMIDSFYYNINLIKDQTMQFKILSEAQQINLCTKIDSGEISAQYSQINQTSSDNFTKAIKINGELTQTFIDAANSSHLILVIKGLSEFSYLKVWYNQIGDNKQKRLNSLRPILFSLQSQSYIEFVYQSQVTDQARLSNDKKIFAITVQNLTDNLQPNNLLISVYNVYKGQRIQELSYSYEIQTNEQIYREYPDEEKEYIIKIFNKDQIEQNYQIQCFTTDLRPLIPEFKQFGAVKLYDSLFFFYTTPSSAQENLVDRLFIKVQMCDGLFQLLTGSNLNLMKDGQYDRQIVLDYDIQQQTEVFFTSQILYFQLKLQKIINSRNNQCSFTIQIYELKHNEEVPFREFNPGNEGKISHQLIELKSDDALQLIISCSPIQRSSYYLNSSSFQIEFIQYFLLLKPENEFNYCTEPDYKFNYSQIDLYDQNNIILKAQLDLADIPNQLNYTASVKAQIFIKLFNGRKLTLDYYYGKTKVQLGQIKLFSYFTLILIIIATISVLILTCACLIKIRRRKIESKYEFSDNYQKMGVELQNQNQRDKIQI